MILFLLPQIQIGVQSFCNSLASQIKKNPQNHSPKTMGWIYSENIIHLLCKTSTFSANNTQITPRQALPTKSPAAQVTLKQNVQEK